MAHANNKPNPLIVWLFTTNHKNVGILYLVTSLYFLVVAGILALTFRMQLSAPNMVFLAADSYNQAVTLHGLFMLLWVTTPLAAAFANYVIPIQIGAKDMAFPRLNALSYWLYLASGIVALSSFFAPGGTADWGWTTYAPLNTLQYSPQAGGSLMGLAILLLLSSTIVATSNFMVTIFRLRAPGMKLSYLPLFSIFWLVTQFLLLWAFPAFAAPLLMLVADRVLGTVFFTAAEGGALLWDHLLWFFGHPEVYILVLPGLAIAGDVLAVFSRRQLYAKKVIIIAVSVAAFLSYIVWVHHMFMTGIHPGMREVFNITTELISIPFGVIMLSYILTLFRGRIRATTPFLFALGSVILFIIGGASGVFNSSVALDVGMRGTFWVVGHFHYTIVGGGITGLIAGLYYWWPKMTGRMFSEKLGKLHFAIYMIGFNILYFPMHLLYDMPRRIFFYDATTGWGPINMIITMGSLIFASSFIILFINLINSLRHGPKVGDDPWGGANYSLEWNVPSPPPEFNFPKGVPVITAQGLVFKQPWEIKKGITTTGGQQLFTTTALPTNGGSHVTEHGEEHGPHLSPWPFILSIGAALTMIGLVFGVPLLLQGIVIFIASIVGWAWEDVKEKFHVAIEALGEKWPFDRVENVPLGMWFFLFGEVALFGPLFAAYFFVRANSAFTGFAWPLPGQIHSTVIGAISTIILLTSGLAASLALVAIKNNNQRGLRAGLLAAFILGLAVLVIEGFQWAELFAEGYTFGTDIAASIYYVITGIHGAHLLAGLLIIIYLLAKAYKGGYNAEKHMGVYAFAIYWGFVVGVWLFTFPLFYLI